MSEIIKVTVPDIGDFSDVEIIEVLVAAGERIDAEQPVITLESDKASMDVPAPAAGVVHTVHVAVGERVSEGSLILDLGIDARAGAADAPEGEDDDAEDSFLDIGGAGDAADAEPVVLADEDEALAQELRCQVVVLGAGPGGYTAAFRAADLGLKTVLVERYPTLGGVCLNVGCIPSKALLHTAEVIAAARAMADHGVAFGEPTLDLPRLVGWKNSVVAQLTKGLAGLARQRKVEVVQGVGSFEDASTLRVDGDEGVTRVRFDNAIIAAGSQAVQIPGFPNDDPRLMDSTDALELDEIPGRMLVIGGGIIGLEMACVYSALGSTITVVELLDGLMPGTDRDLVRPLEKRIRSEYENIFVGTRVTGIEPTDAGLRVSFDGAKAPESDVFDRVLVAVGRAPNGHRIGAANAGVNVDERGFIAVDRQQRTNVAHIFAIGDIVGQPMLAHKATHEGKVAAEVAAGMKSGFDALTIPSVAYTDPEVAWCGLTESEAKEQGVDYEKGSFPWAASGRALGIGRSEGLTKVLFDAHTGRVLGAGIVGPHAGDLIAEATLALELGADAQDLGLTIHPHPTLSETVNFAAEIAEGTITDLYLPKKRK
jgi:dihydrolipoamide dehydrogenase